MIYTPKIDKIFINLHVYNYIDLIQTVKLRKE